MKLKTHKYFSFIITAILCAAIVIVPLISDQDNLPLGWDIPKVDAWWVVSIVLIIASLGGRIAKQIESKNLEIYWTDLFLSLLITYLLITAFLSPYSEIALEGNRFREQGAIIFSLIIAALWLSIPFAYKFKECIGFAFVTSALFQSLSVLYKFVDLYQNNRDLIDDGQWIYGTFGQVNFMAGHVLIGSLLALHFVITSKNFSKRLLFISIFVITAIAIGVSYSTWGQVSLALGIVCLIIFNKIQPKYMQNTFILGLFMATLLMIPGIRLVDENVAGSQQRVDIWENTIDIYSDVNNPQRLFFGTGPDTLAEVFKDEERFTDLIIDRAHNFFLDIWVSGGLLLLTAFFVAQGYILFKIKPATSDLLLVTLLLVAYIWQFRSFVHTSSIVNLVDFGIIFGLVVYGIHKPQCHRQAKRIYADER